MPLELYLHACTCACACILLDLRVFGLILYPTHYLVVSLNALGVLVYSSWYCENLHSFIGTSNAAAHSEIEVNNKYIGTLLQ